MQGNTTALLIHNHLNHAPPYGKVKINTNGNSKGNPGSTGGGRPNLLSSGTYMRQAVRDIILMVNSFVIYHYLHDELTILL